MWAILYLMSMLIAELALTRYNLNITRLIFRSSVVATQPTTRLWHQIPQGVVPQTLSLDLVGHLGLGCRLVHVTNLLLQLYVADPQLV